MALVGSNDSVRTLSPVYPSSVTGKARNPVSQWKAVRRAADDGTAGDA